MAPREIPATTPEVEMVPTAVLLLLHDPPVVASDKVTDEPRHTLAGPVIGATALTGTPAEAVQPFGAVYTIVAVPLATPVTVPPEETVAIAGVALLQVPPEVASLSVTEVGTDPPQIVAAPVTAAGLALTDIGFTTMQPPGTVYVILSVPAATPATIPVEPAVAVPGALLDQVPPDVEWVNEVVVPVQTTPEPLMAGNALTVPTTNELHPPAVSVNVRLVLPADTPVKTPVPELMVPTAVLLLDHVPEPAEFDKVTELHASTGALPVEAPGAALIVTVCAAYDPHGAR